ncbi:LysE family translocator [Pseudomonas sp. Marseille-P9899]|uniref:LysE family translocator n=1 Tax=Pseudomonas sp. Marseille-P9899 TaxID=2730401 RepID=UPI0015882E42|nr:LysE family translocator [Pseudomonas sp. Marseille-P9899]
MSSTTVWAFWAFSMIFVVIPGPDWAYAIAAGVRGRGVMAAVCGLLVGYLALTLAVATGFAVLGASSSAFITGLTVVGALYLGWLGVGLLQNPPVPQAGASDADGVSRVGQFLRGTLVSGLNPKGLLFFLAFVPPWTSAQASWSVPVQIAVLGLVYTASCAVVYSMVGLGASAALKTRPAAARMMGRLSGGVMVVLAVVLVGELFWV